MILFYELTQSGVSHAPFAHAFVHTIAHAYPDEPLTIHAQQSHLDSAFGKPDAVLDGRLTKVAYEQPVTRPNNFFRHFRAAYSLMQQTWTPLEQRPQVIFLTSEPRQIWAMKAFRLLHPTFRCHMVMHGDLNNITLPRSRNPFVRALDYFSALSYANHPSVRFLTLETHIGANLVKRIPSAAPVTDVLRLPCMQSDIPWQGADQPADTIRFGFLGIAGPSKGLDIFARMAREISRTERFKPDFRLIGKLQKSALDWDFTGISGPLPFSEQWLDRDLFESEVASLQYAILPYNMSYYGLASSGVLLDVLRWRKPVIALDTPVVRELEAMFGDIGYICADEQEMIATAENLLRDFDASRYARQRANLDAAYASRLPDALAPVYRKLQKECWTAQDKA